MMIKICFIIHGKTTNKVSLSGKLKKTFDANNFIVKIIETEYASHAILLTESVVNEGFTIIVACGGDGTLNEVVNGVMNVGNESVKVCLLPNGSGNDFAKTIIPTQTIESLKEAILTGSIKKIDVGLATFKDKNGQQASRYYINITDVGIGGVIAKELFYASRFFGATLTYQYFILKNFITYRPQNIIVKGDDFVYESKVMNFCAANGKFFGSGLGIAPEAKVDDGLIEAVAIGDVNLIDYFLNFPKIKRCERLTHKAVKYFKSKSLSFESESANTPIDMDGEFVGFLPMSVTVKHKSINFIV
ncbi:MULTISPECIES: diacylglycerol kinase family protein [Emticicia]|uniref:diacylglycerol/lipid kinase family protein n=1 Tax=Emticicia TaxID=312278 RepID=UPI0007D8BAEE|nr:MULTISPECIES: YegS/Rv2252/BmrU family lipid kinase [Emticicia]